LVLGKARNDRPDAIERRAAAHDNRFSRIHACQGATA
jgi:hypothetical protein